MVGTHKPKKSSRSGRGRSLRSGAQGISGGELTGTSIEADVEEDGRGGEMLEEEAEDEEGGEGEMAERGQIGRLDEVEEEEQEERERAEGGEMGRLGEEGERTEGKAMGTLEDEEEERDIEGGTGITEGRTEQGMARGAIEGPNTGWLGEGVVRQLL